MSRPRPTGALARWTRPGRDDPPAGQLDELVRRLRALGHELRGSPLRDEPDVWAAGEAVECAVALLRARLPGTPTQQTTGLLLDGVALARSAVEAAKYALRQGGLSTGPTAPRLSRGPTGQRPR